MWKSISHIKIFFCTATFIYFTNKPPRPKGRGIRRFASQLPEVAESEERRKRRGIYPPRFKRKTALGGNTRSGQRAEAGVGTLVMQGDNRVSRCF